MTPPFAPRADHRTNAFDLMRIVAALMVLFSHQFSLTGRVEWTFDNWQSLGGIGLLIFFTMSGFLVCESWMRDPNVWRFAARRLLRIWPALAVVVTLTAGILGPLVTSVSSATYFGSPELLHYFGILRFNSTDHLPGVFDGNPSHGVNGSLWTLPIEFRWYEFLAAAGVLGVVRWRWILLGITTWMAVDYFVIFDVQRAMLAGEERHWKEELGLYFMAGVCLQRYLPEWSCAPRRFALAVALAGVVLVAVGQHHFAYWVWLPTATIFVARLNPRRLWILATRGDWSYGVYIYAFPVQQTIVAVSDNAWPFAAGLAAATAITLFFAWLSWSCVESPSLRFKPRTPEPHAELGASAPLKAWVVRTFGLAKSPSRN